jgi:hypothetical protein
MTLRTRSPLHTPTYIGQVGAKAAGPMTGWLIRRLIQAFFVVLAMSLIVFIGCTSSATRWTFCCPTT